jgi:hypothetical protein
MKVAKVSDLENLADGTVIREIRLQIKAAFSPKTGEGKYGPWRVQAAILKDETGEVRASFWTEEDIQKLVGKTLTFKSNAGKKGLDGVSVKFSSHSGKNELNINDKAGWNGGDDGHVAAYVKSHPSSVPDIGKADPEYAIKRISQSAKLYTECLKQALKIHQAHSQLLMPEHLQAICASLYISSDRAGLAVYFDPDKAVLEVEDHSADIDIPF